MTVNVTGFITLNFSLIHSLPLTPHTCFNVLGKLNDWELTLIITLKSNKYVQLSTFNYLSRNRHEKKIINIKPNDIYDKNKLFDAMQFFISLERKISRSVRCVWR